MNFSERLRRQMKLQGITEIELSRQLDVTPQAVSRMLNGKVGKSFEKLPRIARILNCSIDSLFPEMDETNEDDDWAGMDLS